MSANSRSVVLTIDAGSGSTRVLAWDPNGRILGLVQREWDYETSEHPGGLDFKTAEGWALITECIRGVLEQRGPAGFGGSIRPEDVKAITCTSMREGFVLFDEAGEELWAVPNVDARAQKEAKDLLDEGHGDAFYRESGDWTSLAASARLRWVRDNEPEIWERAARMTMLGEWALYRLSGEFISEPSLGSSSALYNIAERTWSEHIARTLEIEHLLPPVAEAGTVIGAVTAKAAAETGLLEGTPVVAGGADTQLGLLGAGIVEDGQMGVVGGTFWLTAGVKDTPVLDDKVRLRTLCHAIEGKWMIEGCGFGHGLSTRWVRDGLLRAANPLIGEDYGYQILTGLAEEIPPGSNGVHYFSSDVMNARRWRHPVPGVVGANPFDAGGNGLGAIFRAVMESATYVSRGHKELIEEVWGQRVDEVAFVGGPSRSELWCQMLADVLGVRVRIPDVAEGTCLGAAIAALVGIGIYPDAAEASRAMVHTARYHDPDPETAAAYDELDASWRALNDHMLRAADEGLAPYMWVGAGAASDKALEGDRWE
jgi:autoinducer 2 (AI-2) kinase